MNNRCACICSCGDFRARDCSDLCADCWRLWCVASKDHAPIANRSYIGTYGITGVWLAWLMGRAPHLVAEPAGFLMRAEVAPHCHCGALMVRRPGAWKCYRHEEPVVSSIAERFPRSPQLGVLP